MDVITGHQIKVNPFGLDGYYGRGYFASCSCGWSGTVHGRELDASEDGKDHTLIYGWNKNLPDTRLLLWNQAVAVLREDNYQITQSTQNYAYALSQVGLGSPADEGWNIPSDCNCHDCNFHRWFVSPVEELGNEQ